MANKEIVTIEKGREKEIKSQLRKRDEVIGIWDKLVISEEYECYIPRIIYQLKGEGSGAREIIIYPDGREVEIGGNIVNDRRNTGNPTRLTLFKPQDGSENILLEEGEF